MMGRWDETENPYEELLRKLMPQRVDNKKEVKAMESRELMNSMKKGQLVKVPMFSNDIWRIEAFDYLHGRVGVRSINEDKPHFLRWFAPEELNRDIRQGRRLDGYQAYCMADIAATHLLNENFGVPDARMPKAKKVIYDEAAGVTVVLWMDGTKTIVRAAEGEKHDAYLGYCVALAKKMHGTNSALKRNLEKVLVVRGDKKLDIPVGITGSMAESIMAHFRSSLAPICAMLAPADEENK